MRHLQSWNIAPISLKTFKMCWGFSNYTVLIWCKYLFILVDKQENVNLTHKTQTGSFLLVRSLCVWGSGDMCDKTPFGPKTVGQSQFKHQGAFELCRENLSFYQSSLRQPCEIIERIECPLLWNLRFYDGQTLLYFFLTIFCAPLMRKQV